MSDNAMPYFACAAVTIIMFMLLWEALLPSGPDMGVETLAIAAVSGLCGALVAVLLSGIKD